MGYNGLNNMTKVKIVDASWIFHFFGTQNLLRPK
jgi:hypothetical protein